MLRREFYVSAQWAGGSGQKNAGWILPPASWPYPLSPATCA